MWQLIEDLSLQNEKKFIWKFSATFHGKGVIDGICGNVKLNVRLQITSMNKDQLYKILKAIQNLAKSQYQVLKTSFSMMRK